MRSTARAYVVAFPDGAGFNPGYRLVKNPSYPGIADDYRRTHHFLETLKPDIWLAQHNEYYDLESKRQRAQTEGVKAWMDPEGYRRFIAGKKRDFEDEVDEEMGVVKKGDKEIENPCCGHCRGFCHTGVGSERRSRHRPEFSARGIRPLHG